MGDLFQSWQAEQFKHRRDASLEQEFQNTHLFSNCPEVLSTHYQCTPVLQQVDVSEGEVLLVRSHPACKGIMQVIQGQQVIAQIEGSGGQTLQHALDGETRGIDIFTVCVLRKSTLNQMFEVCLNEATNGDKKQEHS